MKITIEKISGTHAMVKVWETDAALEREVYKWPVSFEEIDKSSIHLASIRDILDMTAITSWKTSLLETS